MQRFLVPLSQVHPRMRGEKHSTPYDQAVGAGSPPHARGKVMVILNVIFAIRFTPACAGKSGCIIAACHLYKVHPRMRGEKAFVHFYL